MASSASIGVRRSSPADLLQKVLGQRNDVAGALAEGRGGERKDAQPVIEVFAKLAGCNVLTQIAVGRGDHAHIERDLRAAADALDFAFLQNAQQLGLQADIHLADFIEQQGAALGLFELSWPCFMGAGEGAFFVAEQQCLQHVLRNRRTVDRDKRAIAARSQLVQQPGQYLLAGTAFAR
jgi:hypothetical protein